VYFFSLIFPLDSIYHLVSFGMVLLADQTLLGFAVPGKCFEVIAGGIHFKIRITIELAIAINYIDKISNEIRGKCCKRN